MSEKQIISGDLLLFDGDPFAAPVEEVVTIQSDGALLIEDGLITASGQVDLPWLHRCACALSTNRDDRILGQTAD